MSISAETALQMFDNLSTAVMLFDKDLHLTCINNACEDLLSISKRRVIGQTPQEIIPQYPVLADTIERTLKTGSPYTERSLSLTLPNSRSVTVDCKVTPIMNGDACSEVIVELIDADSLHRVMREENLEILHDAARESVRGIAHEIKNPLGGIRGAAQLLERELNNEDSGLIEYTQIIIHEADRLRNFIDRMLVSDRKLNMGKVNIHELLEYVCSLVEAEFDESFEIIRDYDPSLPLLSADREQVIQAVLNIMRNAVQALATDGHIWLRTRVLRQITIQKRVHRLVVRLDIIDDGPGIPAGIEKGIFYPMITSRAEGTGLGLSIAQSLVKLHGGLIEYERKDEKTVFSIYLPMEQNHV
ncbi:MAG: PAS domain-containing protein [Gammaproteobacteria bacterium]|nr:PAS domain-containing protein [Gammaproteobacteria bacterium]